MACISIKTQRSMTIVLEDDVEIHCFSQMLECASQGTEGISPAFDTLMIQLRSATKEEEQWKKAQAQYR